MILAMFLLLLISNTAAAILSLNADTDKSKVMFMWVVLNISADVIFTFVILQIWCELVWPFLGNQVFSMK